MMKRHLYYILTALLTLASLNANATIYYVTYDGQPVTDGWQTVTTLADAFTKAKSGDEIWIQGSDDVTKAYHITAGLIVKSGVKVYGGFKGNETGIGQREYQGKKQYRLRYRSLISREVNSHIDHVLTMDLNPAKSGNNNTLPTIVNGMSLSNNWPQDNGYNFTEKGGGIFVTGDNSLGGAFHIEQCCLVENRAAEGAGIYVDSNVQTTALGENLIDHCAVFNNVAGSQNVLANNGGGLYIAGAATVVNSVIFNNVNGGVKATAKTDNSEKAKIVSCSITRNNGSGIDGPGMPVYNTVIWGNTIFTTSEDTKPDFYHSAFSRATPADMRAGNKYLSIRNRDTEGPDFVSPSLRRGYDADFKLLEDDLYPYWDWEPNGVTILVDSGDNSLYDASRYGNVDMNDESRIYNETIDIGAYEYEPVAGSRIRYVMTDGMGRGASWSDASNDLQAMIDELAESGGGEVWVAAGTYSPKVPLVSSLPYTAAFRMRDGVSVYGGFAGTETDKTDRKKKDGGMPWDFIHETTLQGASYIGSVTWGNNELSVSSDSRHVVWFAPFLPDGAAEKDFSTLTRLEGFTVRGGNAQGGNGETDFLTDRGGGIYMKGQNVMVENCIIKENSAMRHGGGVYMADGARLRTSLVYNNNAGDDGGAAYVEHDGLIHRCMLANNYGDNGSGIYLNAIADKPTAVTASTNVITNNTARNNGAVYCNLGGVLLHNTIANNYCPKSVDAAYTNTSQTGGVYINEYALLVNSVLWNNRFGSTGEPADVPVYAKNPTNAKVRLFYNAISGADNAIWNYITQEGTVRILENNQKTDGTSETLNGPAFSTGGVMTSNKVLKDTYGVQENWKTIDYYWKPMKGSSLWSAGMPLPQFPPEVQLAPELDVEGVLFAEKPTIGAFHGDNIDIRYDATTDPNKLIVYVAYGHASTYDDGGDWDHPYRSINNAITYLSNLSEDVVNGRTLEVRVMEGDLWPRYAYTDEDGRSATIVFKQTASDAKLRLVGGYYRDGNNVRRAPIDHRSVLNGNPDGETLENGFYHVVTVEEGADIELDGMHIVNGYVSSDAVMPHGAGLLAYGNAKVTLLNCTFEDNTAVTGAAIYAPSTTTVIMRNCVVNNNTCSTQTNPLIVADNLTMEHVTIVNNVGVAKVSGSSSFAAGNTSGNTLTGVATVGGMGEGQKGQLNFANPTNDVGAKLGFDTYLGGYTVFRPLTSSNDVSVIINKATGTSSENTQDITAVNDRDLGGVSDLGAYEAELPKKGTVIYVRDYGNTTEPGGDGSSWSEAINGNCTSYRNNHGFQGYDAELYKENKFLTGLQWAVDEAYYRSLKRNADNSIEYTGKSVYKTETPGSGWKSSTLQVSSIVDANRVQVWVAEGEYLRREGFFMRDGVDVFGGFPSTGNPGTYERQPRTYETIIETNTTEEVNSSDFNNWGQYLTDTGDYISEKSKGWKVVDFSSEETGDENGMAANAIDGNENTLWHTIYKSGNGTQTKNPHHITIDLGEILNIETVNLKHRRYGFTVKVYLSETLDDIDAKLIASDSYASSDNNNTKTKTINLGKTVNARFLKLVFTNPSNSDYADIKEIGINGEYGAESTYYDITHDLNGYKDAYEGSRVLTQPFPYYVYDSTVGDGGIAHMELKNNIAHGFVYDTSWDGLIIQNGRVRIRHQRDGGAGLALRYNGHIKNCIIRNNVNTASWSTRGGGCFQNDGIIENSIFSENDIVGESGQYVYGSALYLRSGIVFNTLFSGNKLSAKCNDPRGTAIFFEVAKFYNNTITGNVGASTVYSGNYFAQFGYSGLLEIYNTIDYGNTPTNNPTYGDTKELDFETQADAIKITDCLLKNSDAHKDGINKYAGIKNIYYMDDYPGAQLFQDQSVGDYSLHKTSPAINKGTDVLGKDLNGNEVTLPSYDADYTDRIKDCRVDIGAYEFENIAGTTPEIVIAADDSNRKMAVYYVTQNGNETGNMSGSSLDNAACATKLQTVLDAAGEYARKSAKGEVDKVDAVIVKVAGYANTNAESTPYHATKLADEKDPQSYSYSVPYGVTLMGGFNDLAADWNDSADRKKDDNGNVIRDVMKFPTVLSPIKKATATTTQDINGYHAVTFMEKPQYWTGADAKTIIDGVYLEGGAATSLAGEGNPNTQGGGAIVPAWAHVRNCVVQNNTAMYGGGLYVLPGGTVSGCAILRNTAEKEGGGIYVSAKGLTTGYPAYLISNTIADNEAQLAGGVYSEKGAAMFANSVIFGNNAGSNKNVSADLNPTKAELFEQVYKKVDGTSEIEEWYPFNKCYVEAVELPGNFFNMSMINDKTTYFNDDDDYTPKPYSLLISHGMTTYFQQQLEALLGVAAYDMRGVQRVDYPDDKNISVDCGAYAVIDAKVQDQKLVKRLFVSRGLNVIMGDGTYIGQSFYTPFSWLGDALEYIREIREVSEEARKTTFEIFVASGTYKPRRRRADAHTVSGGVTDQRQNSFTVPYNVKIYGGFSGYETYCSHEDGGNYSPAGVDGTLSFVDITGYEAERIKKDILDKREYSDYNGNNILEPWEMAHGTILSGAIDMEGNEQNTYHVLYSDRGTSTGDPETQNVTLDGLTVMNGKTKDFLYSETGGDDNSEVGRGAGLYSNGVDYKIVNCRFMDNEAVRGGGIYVRNGNLTSINSAFAGCCTVDDKNGHAAGGGVYMAVIGTATEPIGTFRAVNTIFVNNTSVGTGGAIHVAGGSVDLMNNTIVSNKTSTGPVISSDANNKVKMVNTLLWNNKSDSGSDSTIPGAVDITYSASDIDYNDLFAAGNTWHNFKLVSDNMDLSGPRFANPNMQVGAANYNPVSNWNPIAQSPLTDTGSGKVLPEAKDYTKDEAYVKDDVQEGDAQAYRDWFNRYAAEYINDYMRNADYLRYSGPLKDDGTADDRPIDIGLYEYQYRQDFSTMDAIYVDVFNRGLGNGQNWMNATDDLRGAIIGASNPTSNNNPIRRVFVKAGEYVDPLVALGYTYALHTGDKNGLGWTNFEIYGSCTGTTIKLKEQETQDFSAPTVIHNYPDIKAQKLLDISSDKNVFLSGITFINNTGCGIYVSSNSAPLTLRHVAIRACDDDGLQFDKNTGKVLLVNTLFADNKKNGLNVGSVDGDNITLVNTTFAQNGTDMSKSLLNVYNSTSWNNTTQHMIADNITEKDNIYYNKVFIAGTVNDDLNDGPRFRDPDNAKLEDRDYRIRPNFTLLNMGNEATYKTQAGVADMSAEKDLNNVARVVGGIDIGAYEFESDLRPIIYVKPGLLNSDKSGKDWDNAIDDLQDAVDLAGMYVNANKDKTNAYVFAHHTLKDTETLQVKYQGVKVYGGMNDEATTDTETDEIVTDLLDKRVGLLERDSRSELNGGLVISGENSVVDGFEVNVSPVINKGILSTSVVTKDVTGIAGGILYNTLVKGSVSGVKTVNVTATGVIEDVEGNGNNRTGAAGDNRYVTTDDWEYQLMETSADIDAGTTGINDYITMVGHSRDIAGNKRIRNTVDNGCFETWNITKEMTADNVVTEDDYPHGKSVVYVRHTDGTANDGTVYDGGAELLITKNYTDAAPFNPGFLLLEHHAGLRANNKAVGLTHFAVERNIGASGTDMTVMPFEVTRTEGTAMLSLYDAATRAGYSYQYSGTDGAWTNTNYNTYRTPITTGWLLEGTAGSKVRFYGDSYVENVDAGKSIELLKNNFNEPWTSSSAGGNRFTHKENMSWNLFGSPYLCAMNYSDMKYGRVMYGYQNGAYTTLNTIDDNAEGYIPAGDAVFTQTATLKERETIEVEIPTADNEKSGTAYLGSKDMAVALSHANTRSGGDGQEDRLQLKAVPAGESRSDFDINGDGVKWMSAGRPQIYARQGGGRYSLLSAVSIEGEVSVGVSLPEAGMYTFAIPGDCNVDGYGTVVLKDNETGRLVDLLEGDYDFSVAEAGDVEGRFTISFNRMLDDKASNDLRIWCPDRNTVRVEGTKSGDIITIYSVSGVVTASRIASSSVENIPTPTQGVAIVEVRREGYAIVRKSI